MDFFEKIEPILKMDNRQKAYKLMAQEYLKGTDGFREFVKSNWDFEKIWRYPNPMRLLCVVGEDWSRKEKIEASLAYYSINERQFLKEWDEDFRNVLIGIAAKYNSCVLEGLSPDEEFKKIILISSAKVKDILNGFLSRDDSSKSLKAFGLIAHKNNNDEIEFKF